MASQSALRKRFYTWDDYRTWDDDQRWELVDGQACGMTPAPSVGHQAVVSEMYRQMANWFAGKRCRALVSPFDVKLSRADVVQPDIVVCEPSKIKPTHIEGAPALVVEVMSPSTEAHDRLRKMDLYARSGVEEVWLVSPVSQLAEVFSLDGDTYRLKGTYIKGDVLKSATFRGLTVDLDQVFHFPCGGEDRPWVVREPGASYGPQGKRGPGGGGVKDRKKTRQG